MQNFFYKLWRRLENISVLDTDSPAEKRKKMTLVMIIIFCHFVGFLTITNQILTSRTFSEMMMPLIFNIVVGTALIIYFFTKQFAIFAYPFLIMILCIPVVFQIIVGGFSGQGAVPVIFWSFLAPFGSLMFQNPKRATWWFAAFLIILVVFLMIDKNFTQLAEAPISFAELSISHSDLMVNNGIIIVILAATIFYSMRYYVHAFQKEHNRAENLVAELTDTSSELKSTLKVLHETKNELVQSEKMAALGKLAAGIAHEINNPIGALKSTAGTSTQCLTKIEQIFEGQEKFNNIGKGADLRNFFQILKDSGQVFLSVSERLSNSVNSFINFARLDKTEFDKFDIHQGLDDALNLLQNEIGDRIARVKDFEDIPQIACYPRDLNQVFYNLLTNSAKAIAGKGTITIRTQRTQRTNDRVCRYPRQGKGLRN